MSQEVAIPSDEGYHQFQTRHRNFTPCTISVRSPLSSWDWRTNSQEDTSPPAVKSPCNKGVSYVRC